MTPPLLARLLRLTAYGLFALAFVPILCLSWFNHPSAADDYCFADTATRFGFWPAQKFYYDGWTGRYFSNFLVHGSPLVWGWYGGFKLIPALMAAGLVTSMCLLINELVVGLVPSASIRRVGLLITALFFFVYILALPSTVEAFVWLASMTVYTVPTALMLYWGAVLLRWYRQPAGTLHTLTGIWAGVLIFLIVGCGETHMLLIISLLLSFLTYQIIRQKRIDWALAGLLAVAVASAWLVFRAPGNAVRMSGGATNGDLAGGLRLSLNWLVRNVPVWFLKTPLLPLSAIWVVIGNRYLHGGGTVPAFFRVPLWYAGLVVAGLLLATVLPSFYATKLLTLRAINVTYLVFLVGWFYLITSQLTRISPMNSGTLPGWLVVFVGGWIVINLWVSLPLKQLYGDLLRGHAATYDREMTTRHRQLLQPARQSDTVRLSPLSVYPASLFLEDVRTNPTHWWNRCQSGYYGHSAIIIDTTLRQPATRL